MIRIQHVNKPVKSHEIPVYCGRAMPGHIESPLRNEFRRGNGQPGSTLPKYREWLWKLVKPGVDSPQRKQLQLIASLAAKSDVVLQCWCHDENKCHCSVIRKAVEWIATTK